MPNRTRQSNKRRSERAPRPAVTITPTESGIPAEWQQPSRQPPEPRSRSSPSRPAEPSAWQKPASPSSSRVSESRQRAQKRPAEPSSWQSPGQQRSAASRNVPQTAQSASPARRRRKRRPPLLPVLFPGLAKRAQRRRRSQARPESRAERQRQRLRRQQRYLILSRIFTLVVIMATGLVAMTLFFKVDSITVEGRSRYTHSQLLETAAIEQGDNLFLMPTRMIRKRLMDAYPYLDIVRIQRKPPNKVVLQVEDAQPAAAVGSGTTYYYMDAGGKLLEEVAMEQLGGVPVVTGVTIERGEVGKRLNMRRDDKLRQLTVLLTALEEQGLMGKVDFINLSDMANVRIGYNKHMYIRFGTMDELDKKMRFAKKFVDETSASLYCEVEVSGEILWENHPSYRVIPVTPEEVQAQSRDLDENAVEGEDPTAAGTTPATGQEGAAAPVLGGTPAGGAPDGETGSASGETGGGSDSEPDSGDGKPNDGESSSGSDSTGGKDAEDGDTNADDDTGSGGTSSSSGSVPALSFPAAGGGNWRNAQ